MSTTTEAASAKLTSASEGIAPARLLTNHRHGPDYTVLWVNTFKKYEEFFPRRHEWYPSSVGPKGRTASEHELIPDARPGLITKSTRVATMGSCFAHEIKKWLLANRYAFVRTEEGLPGADEGDSGSAHYREVYNTACMAQIVEHAYGRFSPIETHWALDNGWLADPYRRGIGWPDERSMVNERKAHARAVREVVEQAEVFIATAGLAEVWRRREDKATFFMIPCKEVFDEAKHECVLTSVSENVENLERFYRVLREHNPMVQLVLSLSPVPMTATFRKMSAVVADTMSKAVLRVAIDEFCRGHPEVIYFPSYEYVMRLADDPFKEDRRHVKSEVVDRLMRMFMTRFGDLEQLETEADPRTSV